MKKFLCIFLSIIMLSTVSVSTTSLITNVNKANIDEKTNTEIISEEDLEKEYNSGYDAGKKSQETTISELEDTVSDLNTQLEEKDTLIAEKDTQLSEKDSAIAEKDSQIAEKDDQISELSSVKSDYDALLSGEKVLVTFKVNDEIYDTQILTSGTCPTLPENPASDDSIHFCGWKDSSDNKVYNIPDKPVTSSSTYSAILVDNFSIYHRVSFRNDYITCYQYVANGDCVDFSLVNFPDYDIYDKDYNKVDISQPSSPLINTQFTDYSYWVVPTSDYMINVSLLNTALSEYAIEDVVFENTSAVSNYSKDVVIPVSNKGNINLYFDSDNVKKAYVLSDGCIYFNTCEKLFKDLRSLSSVSFNNFSFGYVLSASRMFENCINLTSVKEPSNGSGTLCFGVHTSDFSYMFSSCSSLQVLNYEIAASSVNNCEGMFYYCTKLDNYNVRYMGFSDNANLGYMFAGCSSLWTVSLDLRSSKNISMNYAFSDCTNLKTVYLNDAILNCSFAHVNSMFENCTKLSCIASSSEGAMNISGMSSNMFWNCTSLSGNSGFTYSEDCVTGEYASTDYYLTVKSE